MLAALGGIAFAVWLYFLLGRGGFWRFREDAAPPLSDGRGSVVAVIPARDEAGSIGSAVASLVGQARVIVVDDASSDGTGAIARAAGAKDVAAPALPPGWLDEACAVHAGGRA